MTPLTRPTIAVAVVMDRETKPNRLEDWRHSVTDVVLDEGGFGDEPTVLRDDGQRRSTLHPGFQIALFRDEGGKRLAAEYKMDYLGALPLNLSIRVQADSGFPSVVSEPDGEIAALYKSVARQVAVKIAQRAKDFSAKFPTISISKDT